MATWRVGAARDLPLETADSWDGAAAEARIFEWAGWPDNPDGAKARRGFLIYDADAPDIRGSYKLAFSSVFEGELRAVDAGLRAAASRLPQTDAPQAVLDRARAVLDRYFERIDEEGRAVARSQHREEIFAHPARVLTMAPPDVERLTGLVREQHAFDPAILDECRPFFWPAEISNNRLDAYYTKMASSSLRNYAADAAAGVSFQNSHRTFELGFGRSLTGVYEESAELARVVAEFYTIPGLRLNEVSTDDFILGVRSGLVKDVSIGFYDGYFRCALCGRNIWDWECPHIPGVKYPQRDDVGSIIGEELAFAWVENARLAEASAVYDGATPGAAILKAQQEAEGGRLRPEVASLLEARYRIKLPGAGRHWSGASLSVERRREGEMPGQETEAIPEVVGGASTPDAPETLEAWEVGAQRELIETLVRQLGVPANGSLVEAVADLQRQAREQQAALANAEALARSQAATLERLQPFEQRALDAEQQVAELRPLADDGRQYRTDLLAEALAEGVRAYGAGFASETYRGLLETAPLATVKRLRDDWREIGDRLLPGGRLTVDRAAPAVEPSRAAGTPDAAFLG